MTEQEKQLEKAQKELRSHTEQQAKLARELAEKEEANLQLEEHFSSLQEEVEAKTKKIKKLLTKYQTACRDIEDLREEFQVIHCIVYYELFPCYEFKYLIESKDRYVRNYTTINSSSSNSRYRYCKFYS